MNGDDGRFYYGIMNESGRDRRRQLAKSLYRYGLR
jgi:hypothetical protein